MELFLFGGVWVWDMKNYQPAKCLRNYHLIYLVYRAVQLFPLDVIAGKSNSTPFKTRANSKQTIL